METERERFSSQDVKMQEFSKDWLKSVRKKAAQERSVHVFAPADTGERTLICRYICSQTPPPEMFDEMILLRFVSRIPFLDDAVLNSNVDGVGLKLDVWNTSKSFLELGAGDSEEHAILLCNYFKVMQN